MPAIVNRSPGAHSASWMYCPPRRIWYGMLYALLKAEDYALLGGSLLLFALLAAVMIGTRRLDWYRLTASGSPSRG